MLAQVAGDSGAAGGIILVWFLVLFGLAFIPATIASNKGYSGVGFYFFGLFFFLPALIVALLMKTKAGSRSDTYPTSPHVAKPPPASPTFASGVSRPPDKPSPLQPAPI